MSGFNFGVVSDIKPVVSSRRLKPWTISKVQFKGCRVEHIQGKKDPNAVYDILKIRFEGEDGYYEESVFFPKDGDDKRRTYTNSNGHESQMPSNLETTMAIISQLIYTLLPNKYDLFNSTLGKCKTFNQVCELLIKFTDTKKDQEVKLKLIGKNSADGQVNPCLPYLLGINKDGEKFISDQYIAPVDSDKLAFSDYQSKKAAEYASAKPTSTAKVEAAASPVVDADMSEGEESIDLDALLA